MPQQGELQNPSPHVCPHTISFFLDNWFRKLIQNPKRIAGPYIKEGDIVIDMGCGPGFFSIEMAKMVGQNGRVVAVDLQEKMLGHVNRKAAKHGVTGRMEFHQCGADHIGLRVKADFMLAYYMVHETPSIAKFFVEAASLLRQGGRMLVVEPRFHVTRAMFAETLERADKAGLTAADFPKGKGGRSVLFVK